MSRFWTAVLAAILVVAGAAIGLRYFRPVAAEHVTVRKSLLMAELVGPGTLDATRKAAVSARVQGRLTELVVDRNDIVSPGAVMARIAADDMAAQLASATASYEAAKRAIAQTRADKTRSEATLVNARAALSRQTTLVERGAATQAAFDAALAAQRQGEADLARADAAIEAADAQARAAAASVDVSRALLEETIIRAPFSGVVVSRDRNVGDLITPGTAILQLVDPSSVVLTARFDESAIAAIHQGQPAQLRFASRPDRPISGRVLRLSRQVDTETREFTVDVVPDALPANWAIGQRGTAVIDIARLDGVLAVPSRYVVRRDARAGLWLLVDGRARWRPVELGRLGGDSVEIRGGLQENDVVLSPAGVFERMPVRVSGS